MFAWPIVLAPASRSSVTSLSWKVPLARSTRPFASGLWANTCVTPTVCGANALALAENPKYPYLIATRIGVNPGGWLQYTYWKQLWYTNYHNDPPTTCSNTHLVNKVTKQYPCNLSNPFPGPQFWKPEFVTVEPKVAGYIGQVWDGIHLKLDKIPGVVDAEGNPVWAGSEARSCAPAKYGKFAFSVKFLGDGPGAYEYTYTDPVTKKPVPGAWNVTFGAYTYKPQGNVKTSGIGYCWPNTCSELDFLEWGKSRTQRTKTNPAGAQGPAQWGIQPWYECCTAKDQPIKGCAAPTVKLDPDNGYPGGCPIPPFNPPSDTRVKRWDNWSGDIWGELYSKYDSTVTIICDYQDPQYTTTPTITWECRLGSPKTSDYPEDLTAPWKYQGPLVAKSTITCPSTGSCPDDNDKYFPTIDEDTYIMFNLWMGSAKNPCGDPTASGQGKAHPIGGPDGKGSAKEVIVMFPEYEHSPDTPPWNSVCTGAVKYLGKCTPPYHT